MAKGNNARYQHRRDQLNRQLVRMIDRETTRGNRMSTRELADRYNAALLTQTVLDPDNAPTSGPIVGFNHEGNVSKPSKFQLINFKDLKFGHVTPVFMGE